MTPVQGDLLILEDHNKAVVPLAYDEVGGIKNIAWNNLPAVKVSAFGSHYGATHEVRHVIRRSRDKVELLLCYL